eukprot:GHVT01073153.1.p1 GENE.GHVT01073153.1~~GHVT01073153.1.p1  ORF type:complete len:474 (-),score=51.81 GHVT01073153.1:856-2277(-)
MHWGRAFRSDCRPAGRRRSCRGMERLKGGGAKEGRGCRPAGRVAAEEAQREVADFHDVSDEGGGARDSWWELEDSCEEDSQAASRRSSQKEEEKRKETDGADKEKEEALLLPLKPRAAQSSSRARAALENAEDPNVGPAPFTGGCLRAEVAFANSPHDVDRDKLETIFAFLRLLYRQPRTATAAANRTGKNCNSSESCSCAQAGASSCNDGVMNGWWGAATDWVSGSSPGLACGPSCSFSAFPRMLESLSKEEALWCYRATIRYLVSYEWDMVKTIEEMQKTILWRRDRKPQDLVPQEVEAQFKMGKIYRKGKDKCGRPIVYFRPCRERSYEPREMVDAVIFVLERAIASMDINIGCYQLIFILDFNDFQLIHVRQSQSDRNHLSSTHTTCQYILSNYSWHSPGFAGGTLLVLKKARAYITVKIIQRKILYNLVYLVSEMLFFLPNILLVFRMVCFSCTLVSLIFSFCSSSPL